jgi:hypothetical protein
MATDLSQFTVPNDRFDVAQDNAAKLDSVVNGPDAVVTTRTGKGIQSIDRIIASIAAVTDRGAWVTATSYQVKDLVIDTGVFYIAVVAHTSGATFAGDAANWRVYQSIPEVLGDERYGVIFTTTAAMQASSPAVGQKATTNEFSTGNDGGGDYIAEAGDTSNTFDRLLNANGTTYVLQISGPVDVTQLGSIGDYQPIPDAGTDNSAAVIAAYAISKEVHYPDGNFLLTTFNALTSVIDNSSGGPGNLFYDNGAQVEQIGKSLRIGVSDPNGNLGSKSYGGPVIGGEGPSKDGMRLYSAHHSWMQFEPTRTGVQCQVQLYSTGYMGKAVEVNATGFIDATFANFSSTDIVVGDFIGFGNREFKIKTKVSNTRLELETTSGGAVVFTGTTERVFRHVYEYSTGTCNTNGTIVTWESGDYFNVGASVSGQNNITINGVPFAVSSVDSDRQITLTSTAGIQSSVSFTQKDLDLGRQVSLFRIQTLRGGFEENYAIYADTKGFIIHESQAAPGLDRMPMLWKSGSDYDGGFETTHHCLSKDGRIGFGKNYCDPDEGFISDAKMHIWRQSTVASATDGVADLALLALDSEHLGVNGRRLTLGNTNNFNSGYMQGYAGPASATGNIHLQPFGGNIKIGDNITNVAEKLTVAGNVAPATNNTHNLGVAGLRWAEVFASNGVINTSDERAKTELLDYDAAETATALQIKGIIRKFKFNDAVDKKGDDARIHFGVGAQSVAQCFVDNGLDPDKYSMFCYDEWEDKFIEWDEEYVEQKEVREIQIVGARIDGSPIYEEVVVREAKIIHNPAGRIQTQTAGNTYGVRYTELLAFIIGAL